MKVTHIDLYRVTGHGRIKAIVNVVLDNDIALSDLRLVETFSGKLQLRYPSSADSTPSKVRYYCNPINRNTQQSIEQAVLDAYFSMDG